MFGSYSAFSSSSSNMFIHSGLKPIALAEFSISLRQSFGGFRVLSVLTAT